MAKDSCSAIRRAIRECVKTRHLDSSTKDQLEYAKSILYRLYHFLDILEKHSSENWISTQLSPLLIEAYDGFSKILSLLNDQGLTSDAMRMISEVLQIIKPEIIAEQIKASKPPSSRLTMDMVNLVAAVCPDGVYTLSGKFYQYPLLSKKLKNLGVLLKFTTRQCIEHEKMKDLFTLAEDIASNAASLSILCWEKYDDYLARVSSPACPKWEEDVIPGPDFESKFSKFMERISPIRPEWRKLYISVLKASFSSVPKAPILDLASEFSNSVRGDLEELKIGDASLRDAFSHQFRWLEDGVGYLSGYLLMHRNSDILCGGLSSLLSYIEALAKEAGIGIYSLCDVDLEKTTEVDHMLLPLQVKFNHFLVEVMQIRILYSQNTMMVHSREELTFMRTFLMDSLEQHKEQTQLTDVLTLIQSVTAPAAMLMSYSVGDELDEGLDTSIDFERAIILSIEKRKKNKHENLSVIVNFFFCISFLRQRLHRCVPVFLHHLHQIIV